jgi:lipopolysaccharide transport system permease protein
MEHTSLAGSGVAVLPPPTVPTTRIESRSPWMVLNLWEIWEHRSLLLALVERDVKIKYKNMIFGVAWAVFQPVLMVLMFTLFFGRIIKLPSEDLPYPVYALSGLVLWQFFSRALSDGSTSLVSFGGMLSKVYFPRLIAPLTGIASAAIDFCFSLTVLVAVMAFYGVYPGPAILLVPVYLFLAAIVSLSVSLWLAALDSLYRDVRFVLGFATQLLFYATPVVYPATMVPEEWFVYRLNPMLPIVQGFRRAVVGGTMAPELLPTVIAGSLVLISLVGGALFFRRIGRTIADRL